MSTYKPKIFTNDELPTDMEELLTMVTDKSRYADLALRIRGEIPTTSPLGRMYKLHWVAFESECVPQCWVLGCPAPDTHVRCFRITNSGRAALASLQGKPHTRGCDG